MSTIIYEFIRKNAFFWKVHRKAHPFHFSLDSETFILFTPSRRNDWHLHMNRKCWSCCSFLFTMLHASTFKTFKRNTCVFHKVIYSVNFWGFFLKKEKVTWVEYTSCFSETETNNYVVNGWTCAEFFLQPHYIKRVRVNPTAKMSSIEAANFFSDWAACLPGLQHCCKGRVSQDCLYLACILRSQSMWKGGCMKNEISIMPSRNHPAKKQEPMKE